MTHGLTHQQEPGWGWGPLLLAKTCSICLVLPSCPGRGSHGSHFLERGESEAQEPVSQDHGEAPGPEALAYIPAELGLLRL